MLDGADGLAGGVSLVALGLFGSVALIPGLVLDAMLIFTLAGAVFGFLLFNMRTPWRKQASIFMGDAGSMMLGFALVWFAVDLSQIITPVAVVWIFAIPLMDTVSCMLRRILKGRSPFAADREHLHRVFMRAGLSVSGAVWLIILLSFLMGLVGLAGWYYAVLEYVMVTRLCCFSRATILACAMRGSWLNFSGLQKILQGSSRDSGGIPVRPLPGLWLLRRHRAAPVTWPNVSARCGITFAFVT